MPKEYIERGELDRELQGLIREYNRNCESDKSAGAFEALYRLRLAPAADVVEVVRCQNCKHWHSDTGWCEIHSHFIDDEGAACHPWGSADWKMLNDNDYCSYGERKDGADNATD